MKLLELTKMGCMNIYDYMTLVGGETFFSEQLKVNG